MYIYNTCIYIYIYKYTYMHTHAEIYIQVLPVCDILKSPIFQISLRCDSSASMQFREKKTYLSLPPRRPIILYTHMLEERVYYI